MRHVKAKQWRAGSQGRGETGGMVTGLHIQTCYMLLQIALEVFEMELYRKLTETVP